MVACQGVGNVLAEQGRWSGEIWNRRRNGEVYPQWLSLSALRQRSNASKPVGRPRASTFG